MKKNIEKVYKVFLHDVIPLLNKGEEAILQGLINTLIRSFGKVNIKLLTNELKIDKKVYNKLNGVEVIQKENINIQFTFWIILYFIFKKRVLKLINNPFVKAILECDLYLFGHDNILASSKMEFGLLRRLIILKIIKKPIAICVGSFGPFKDDKSVKIAKKMLQTIDLSLFRDYKSYNYALNIYNDKSKIFLVPDLAFLLKSENQKKAKEIFKIHKIPLNKPMIGFTIASRSVVIKNACLSSGKSLEERINMHHRIIAETIKYIQRNYNVSIIFIPHCIESYRENDDRIYSREIINLLEEKKDVWLLEDDYSASILKAVISELDLLIAERTHSLIGAAGVNTPFIAISFPDDFRTYGIVKKTLDLGEYLYDVRSLEKETLCELIDSCWKNRIKIHKKLKKTMPNILKKADVTGKYLFNIVNKKS